MAFSTAFVFRQKACHGSSLSAFCAELVGALRCFFGMDGRRQGKLAFHLLDAVEGLDASQFLATLTMAAS